MRVLNDEPGVLPYLHHLDGYVRCDAMLKWLISNRLVGKEFLRWAKFHFGVSMLDMGKFILKHLEKSKDPKRILVGKDIFIQ